VRGEPVTIVLDRSRGRLLTRTDKLLITLRHLYRFEVVRSIFPRRHLWVGGQRANRNSSCHSDSQASERFKTGVTTF
jgi:hypothetical protein